ncbi:MAG TPA: hypothetical protein PLO67_15910 [Saprospiraceae bacterium]|nr:hypothetical protein [Saprospiraceae bacterium]HPI07676.1 hypothetical protein [Saprospiraceae bacterium]
MDKRNALVLQLELVWWAITAIVVYAVLYPIHQAMQVWPFQAWNIGFIIALITLSRYIFLLPHTFIANRQVLKIGLLLLMFPLTFAFISGLNGFMTYVEEHTWDDLTGHLPGKSKLATESYIWSEMLFFGSGCIIAAPVFAARLMRSIWTTRNRGEA